LYPSLLPLESLMKTGTHVKTPKPIYYIYFINPSHRSACLYVYHLPLLSNGSVKTYGNNEYASNNRRTGNVAFYVVRFVSRGSRKLVLPSTSYLFFMCSIHDEVIF
jgi:hypothetical protein